MSVRANWANWEVAEYLLLALINNMVWYMISAQTGVLTDTDTRIFGGIGSIFRYWHRYQDNSNGDIPYVKYDYRCLYKLICARMNIRGDRLGTVYSNEMPY